MEAQVVIHR
jgi:hypothetical protein